MSREAHAPFCESVGVRFPRATLPVVLCRSREEAESALARMRAWVSANGLMLHPDKTHVGDCRVEGQGFEFLGYRFEAGQRRVRKKSLMSLGSVLNSVCEAVVRLFQRRRSSLATNDRRGGKVGGETSYACCRVKRSW